jgi:hypothetical protein
MMGLLHLSGRLVSVAPTGDLRFDRRFHGLPDFNIECYGVQPTHDGGYILTCGYGVKSKTDHPNETDYDLTWRALVHRTDSAGEPLWQAAYGNRSSHLSNAGEYIIATRDGGYAVYIDSKEWGTVRVLRQKFTLEDAIPLGCPLFLPVHTVNCVQTLKATQSWAGALRC